jgi:hypothetical protein
MYIRVYMYIRMYMHTHIHVHTLKVTDQGALGAIPKGNPLELELLRPLLFILDLLGLRVYVILFTRRRTQARTHARARTHTQVRVRWYSRSNTCRRWSRCNELLQLSCT